MEWWHYHIYVHHCFNKMHPYTALHEVRAYKYISARKCSGYQSSTQGNVSKTTSPCSACSEMIEKASYVTASIIKKSDCKVDQIMVTWWKSFSLFLARHNWVGLCSKVRSGNRLHWRVNVTVNHITSSVPSWLHPSRVKFFRFFKEFIEAGAIYFHLTLERGGSRESFSVANSVEVGRPMTLGT